MSTSSHSFRSGPIQSLGTRADVRQLISPAQCRGARGMVAMSQAELANLAGVSPALICNFESGRRRPGLKRLRALRVALEYEGIIFIDDGPLGPGVHLRD